MKGKLHKTESGWVVKYHKYDMTNPAVPGTKFAEDYFGQYPLIDNGHIDGLKLYASNEGLEVEFEIVSNEGEPLGKGEQPYTQYAKLAKITTPEEDKMVTKCYCGHTTYCDCGPLEEDLLKDLDVTLMDGLENEPYISDDFQIGPDGAYEHTEEWNTSPREKASELIVDYQIKVKSLDYNEAKQCVLVMVDQIKKILYDQDSMVRYDYWFEVKKEIEKL
jgi:hypothetical protein